MAPLTPSDFAMFTRSEIQQYVFARGLKLKQQGTELRGPCPIHSGERDSFALNPLTGFWYCHSQCGRGGSLIGLEMELSGKDFSSALEEVFQVVGKRKPNGKHVQQAGFLVAYDYADEDNKLLFQVVRTFDLERGKGFYQRRPHPDGPDRNGTPRWMTNLEGVRRVLYRLPRLKGADLVLIAEGEKDVHALERFGFIATCNPMGAGKWRDEYSDTLSGKDVVIFPDQDEPGRKHAEQVSKSLAGKARSVRIISPIGEGKDASDWINNGATREAIDKAIHSAVPEVMAEDAEAAIKRVERAMASAKPGELIRAAEVVAGIDDNLERTTLAARLAAAVRGLQPKKTVLEMVEDFLRRRRQAQKDLEDSIERASVGPVNGGVLVGKIEEFLKKYFVLRSFYYPILAVWIIFTHVFQVFDLAAYIIVVSPVKRCGKTNLLKAASWLSYKGWKVVSPSVASLFRKIDKERCTLFFDESDTSFKGKGGSGEYGEALRALLNVRYEVDGTVPRCVGEGANLDVKDFVVGGPTMIALVASIATLPDTVTDRAVELSMQRKLREEKVERFRTRKARPEAAALKKEIEVWAAGIVKDIAFDEPKAIEELNDRAWDVCEPLVAIAARVSPEFETTLRSALKLAFKVGEESEEDDTIAVKLLADIREIFDADEKKDRIGSGVLVSRLNELESSPWSGWNEGKGLKQNKLARLLKPFDIEPRTVWEGKDSFKGYKKEWFKEAWKRYPNSPPPPEGTSHPSEASEPNKDAGNTSLSEPSGEGSLTAPKSASDPHKQRVLTPLTDVKCPPAGEGIGNNGSISLQDKELASKNQFQRELGVSNSPEDSEDGFERYLSPESGEETSPENAPSVNRNTPSDDSEDGFVEVEI